MSFFDTHTSHLTYSQRTLVLANIILLTDQITSIYSCTTLYIHNQTFNTQWNSSDWQFLKCIRMDKYMQLTSKMGKELMLTFSLKNTETKKKISVFYSQIMFLFIYTVLSDLLPIFHFEVCYFVGKTLFVKQKITKG